MKLINKIFVIIFLSACFYISANAQATYRVKYNILPQSKIVLNGTSTLHSFKINADSVDGYLTVNNENDTVKNSAGKISGLKVIIPVKKLDSKESSMNDNMDKALKADKAPDITYQLTSIDSGNISAVPGDSTKLETTGTLTIAGVSKQIKMLVNCYRSKDGSIHFDGTKTVKMTDYNVKPPTMFFGVVKVGDKIAVNFNIALAEK